MSGYTKQIEDRWVVGSKKHDDSYLLIERDSEGVIVAPDGLVAQIVADDKLKAISVINTEYTDKVKALTVDVPNDEVLTWTKQEAEARAYLASNAVETPLLDSLCAARGVTKDYLINKIVEKANAYAVAIGTLIGERQKAENGIV